MTLRKWLTTAVVAAGLGLGATMSASAADTKTEFTFGTLRAATPEVAKPRRKPGSRRSGSSTRPPSTRFGRSRKRRFSIALWPSLELGNDVAKKVLAEANHADVDAPKAVPAILTDEKQDIYLRANLALGFARGLTNGRVYEESLTALSGIKAEQTVDPAAYFFHRAVAEHALIKKDDAMRSIVRLIDDVTDAPDRYKMLATIMFLDMGNWKKDEKDLGNIRRLMDNSERRLSQARGGKITQTIQKKIVFRLDELIKEMEQQAKGGT